MRGFFRSTGGRLTLVTLLLAVIASPLQPMFDVAAAASAVEAPPCGLLAAVDEGLAATC